MRAMVCRAWGAVEDLELDEVAAPTPGDDEILIEVKVTAVNYADSLLVAGNYQTKPAFPFSPGLETAGVVGEVGAQITRFAPGDRVMAVLAHGGLADRVLAKEAECFSIPEEMGFVEAGAFLVGHCKRNDSATPKEVARPRAQAKPPENTAQADTSAPG